jgi:DNA-binding transcriptional MerR regulator
MARKKTPTTALPKLSVTQPTFRSGAVARIAQMPVSTLRIWEQRYQAVGPSTAPSGQRLYSAADVERVLLLRQLTEQGHAIGAMAALDAAQLQQLAHAQVDMQASAQATSAAGKRARPARRKAALRVVVVGQALALRLQRPAVVQRLVRAWQVTVVFESLAEVTHAASGAAVDLLLWQAPGLQVGALPELQAAQHALHARHVAVTYRFAGAAARAEFAGAGARLAREPADDDALGAWLGSLEAALVASANTPNELPRPSRLQDLAPGDVRPRRFDDAALTKLAGQSTSIACECPRHVAELLMQISNFEAYSADCAHRSLPDAELHAYLQRVAGATRALFESALERVARHEGLTLP